MKNYILLSLLSLFVLTACGVETDLKQQAASKIARPAFMVERQIQAGQFNLVAWERMHQRHQEATIYIEGDSINQINTNPNLVSNNFLRINSTPDVPLGLYLASRDQSENLAYLARPCQFIKIPEEKGCPQSYWQENRFTPEIINAYQRALDDIKARYDITAFHIVGYDGGGNIAAVLAAKRSDIITLRTVAGNLNPDFTTDKTNHTTLASNSVMAIDHATALARVPQHHFIGAADQIITPGVYHSYRQMVGLSDCISYSLIQDADHTNGWVERWPSLLDIMPSCKGEIIDEDPIVPVFSDLPEPRNIPNVGLRK
jgi:hypothetical protein